MRSDLGKFQENAKGEAMLNGKSAGPAASHQSRSFWIFRVMSNILFWWVNPLISKGMKFTITNEDLLSLSKSDEGSYLCAKFFNSWEKWTDSRLRLWRTFAYSFYPVFIYIVFLAVVEAGLRMANTLFLGLLIEYFEDSHRIAATGHMYAGLLSASVFLAALFHHQLFFHSTKLGMTVVSMMIAVVFRKVKSLDASFARPGYIINLVSNDIEAFRNAFTLIHMIFIAPLEIIFVTFFLVQKIEWIPTLAGLFTLLLMIPLQALLSKWIAHFRRKLVQSRDTLLKTISDTLMGIQVIKYYSWETPFQKRILQERAHLLNIFYHTSWIKCFNESCAFFSSLIVSTIAFVTYYYLGYQLTASKVFSSLALFFLVQVDITDMFPRAVEFLVRSWVSADRLETFLSLPEVSLSLAPSLPDDDACVANVQNGSFKWSISAGLDDYDNSDMEEQEEEERKAQPINIAASHLEIQNTMTIQSTLSKRSLASKLGAFTLNITNLKLIRGQFVMLIGPVGSGKSSLFSALLGELSPLASDAIVYLKRPVGYASQQNWLFNATILENILLGRPLDPTRLARILNVCCLKADLQSMPLGLKTFVGERGVSLSGGQRARLSLARTLYDYHNIQVYLLDDVLSAVDNIVGNHILLGLIELTKETGAAVILVTHQTQHLESADRIISLRNGKIVFDGNYDAFVEQEGEEDISVYGLTDEEDDDEEAEWEVDLDEEDEDEDEEDLATETTGDQPAFISEGVLGTSATTTNRVTFAVGSYPRHKPAMLPRQVARQKRPTPASPPTSMMSIWRSNVVHQRVRSESMGYYVKQTTEKEHVDKIKAKVKDWKAKSALSASPSVPLLTEDIYDKFIAPMVAQPTVATTTEHGAIGIQAEERHVGKVSYKTYLDFLRLSSSAFVLFLLVVISILPEGLFVLTNEWLAMWCDLSHGEQQSSGFKYYPIILIILTFTTMVLSVVRAAFFFRVVMHGCVVLFEAMLSSILTAPIVFFQMTPIGRILNRFTKDQSFIDEELPWTFFDAVQCFLMLVGTMIIMCVVNYWLIIAVPFVLVFYWYIRHCYLKSSREIKRCESLARSPVYSLLASTLEGIVLLRSFPASILETFERKFVHFQNIHTQGLYSYDSAGRWMAFWLDVSSAFFFFLCTHGSVFASATLNPASVGFALSYVMHLIGLVQWCTRQLAEVENMMTSIERIMAYANLPSELTLKSTVPVPCRQAPKRVAKWTGSQTQQQQPSPVSVITPAALPKIWPEHGLIVVNNLNLTFPTRKAPVLQSITCTFLPKENIAIVGRTGAGKSSFLSAFLRLAEPYPHGCITIDNVNISSLNLVDLRSRISVIPQDPVLFDGTIRFNLDPFNVHSDVDIWNVLEEVRLAKAIQELGDGLESELGTFSSFSVGQKQLFCLARAILRKTRLIFMDEATANIDMETSAYIHNVIQRVFADANVFTIAHRLQTVISYDRVMVLDQGRLVELDTPWRLLRSKRYLMSDEELLLLDESNEYWSLDDPYEELSAFAKMVKEMGPDEQKKMKRTAFDDYFRKKQKKSGDNSDANSILSFRSNIL